MIQSTRLPRTIQRGADQVLTLELYEDNGETEAIPTAASVQVYEGTTLIDTLTATPGVVSSATLLGTTTAGLELAEDWLEVWTVTIDGADYTFDRSASLVRRKLSPTVTVADLHAMAPRLAKDVYADLTALLSTSWDAIQRDLMQRGNRPQLILEPTALHEPHMHKALHIAFESAVQATGDDRYIRQASRYRDAYERSMASLVYRYDSDEDGASTEGDKAATSAVLWGNMPPRSVWR